MRLSNLWRSQEIRTARSALLRTPYGAHTDENARLEVCWYERSEATPAVLASESSLSHPRPVITKSPFLRSLDDSTILRRYRISLSLLACLETKSCSISEKCRKVSWTLPPRCDLMSANQISYFRPGAFATCIPAFIPFLRDGGRCVSGYAPGLIPVTITPSFTHCLTQSRLRSHPLHPR